MSVIAAAQNIASEAKCLVDKVRADADVSSPPILGQGTESSVHHLLSRLLPQRFGLGWGMLTNQEGEPSPQVDTIIYDVWHSGPLPTATPRFPCEAVLGTVEIKRTLKRADIPKSARDASTIKLLKRWGHDHGELPPDGGEAIWHRAALPLVPHCSLLGVLSSCSLDAYARHWQRHYYDVPFGCQLDSLVLIDKGFIIPAAWHPLPDTPRTAFSPIYGMHPAFADETGPSVLLFPRWTPHGQSPFRSVRIGPRTPISIGTALFLGITECEYFALSMWLRVFLAFCAGLLAPSFIPSIGHMSDGLPEGTTTHFLPLAIAADAERSDQQDYVIHEALRLATWFREDD
jgi:hypothetical protein